MVGLVLLLLRLLRGTLTILQELLLLLGAATMSFVLFVVLVRGFSLFLNRLGLALLWLT